MHTRMHTRTHTHTTHTHTLKHTPTSWTKAISRNQWPLFYTYLVKNVLEQAFCLRVPYWCSCLLFMINSSMHTKVLATVCSNNLHAQSEFVALRSRRKLSHSQADPKNFLFAWIHKMSVFLYACKFYLHPVGCTDKFRNHKFLVLEKCKEYH